MRPVGPTPSREVVWVAVKEIASREPPHAWALLADLMCAAWPTNAAQQQ